MQQQTTDTGANRRALAMIRSQPKNKLSGLYNIKVRTTNASWDVEISSNPGFEPYWPMTLV